jgi:hypothetical protein
MAEAHRKVRGLFAVRAIASLISRVPLTRLSRICCLNASVHRRAAMFSPAR